jgi:hypothetical protein
MAESIVMVKSLPFVIQSLGSGSVGTGLQGIQSLHHAMWHHFTSASIGYSDRIPSDQIPTDVNSNDRVSSD